MKTLKELQKMDDNQLYLCDDVDTIKRHGLKEPFFCGGVSWKGAGLVNVLFFTDCCYPISDYVPLSSLNPVENKTWDWVAPIDFQG